MKQAPDAESQALARAQSLHRDVREELTRADSKATTLLSVIGLLLGALVAGAIAGNWTPQKLDNSFEWVFWVAVVLAVVGETRLLLAVLPRVKHDKDKSEARYFGHVVQMANEAELRGHLDRADTAYDQAVDQVWVLSAIVDKKYGHVRRGLHLFAGAVVLAALALVLDGICA